MRAVIQLVLLGVALFLCSEASSGMLTECNMSVRYIPGVGLFWSPCPTDPCTGGGSGDCHNGYGITHGGSYVQCKCDGGGVPPCSTRITDDGAGSLDVSCENPCPETCDMHPIENEPI